MYWTLPADFKTCSLVQCVEWGFSEIIPESPQERRNKNFVEKEEATYVTSVLRKITQVSFD